ncbi:MAG: hypothetical protein PWQ12_166 [Clostridiales bacterium]|nr:hypothetical protein [Clostridiales bacterium]
MNNLEIRFAREEDAADMEGLIEQLGYTFRHDRVVSWIQAYRDDSSKDILVATIADHVIAWCSIEIVQHYHFDLHAEISGFIVDSAYRNQGVGKQIMNTAEKWALDQGCTRLRVRTNVTRMDAHRFYEHCNFGVIKEQYVFSKRIKERDS